jgi:hypothetical protein
MHRIIYTWRSILHFIASPGAALSAIGLISGIRLYSSVPQLFYVRGTFGIHYHFWRYTPSNVKTETLHNTHSFVFLNNNYLYDIIYKYLQHVWFYIEC